MDFKYGKLAPKKHPMTLRFAKYLKSDGPLLPPAKAAWEYQGKIPQDWGMYGNDQYGDCVFAAFAHMIMCWTANTGKIVIPTVEDVLKGYSDVTGFNPTTGANDNGTSMTDAYDYWKSVGIAGHKIDGWVSVDWTNLDHVKLAIYLFGAINPGIRIPASAEEQFDNGLSWDIEEPDGGNRGGHSVPYFGFGAQGDTGVTWGRRQPTSWSWWLKYVEEAYAPLSLDWIKSNTLAPNHIDVDTLEADLKLIAF